MSEGQILPDTEHRILGGAYYSDGEKFHPYLECSCGFETHGSDDWEDAGAQLDEHIAGLQLPGFKQRRG